MSLGGGAISKIEAISYLIFEEFAIFRCQLHFTLLT